MADYRRLRIMLVDLEIESAKHQIEELEEEIGEFVISRIGLFPSGAERRELFLHPVLASLDQALRGCKARLRSLLEKKEALVIDEVGEEATEEHGV